MTLGLCWCLQAHVLLLEARITMSGLASTQEESVGEEGGLTRPCPCMGYAHDRRVESERHAGWHPSWPKILH